MRRGLATIFVSLIALGLLAGGAADAKHPKGDPRLQVVHAFTSAETAGAIATATVSAPGDSVLDAAYPTVDQAVKHVVGEG